RPGRRQLAADVARHQVVLVGAQELLVDGERVGDLLRRDAPDGEADVVEHVVAGHDRLVDGGEAPVAAPAPEVDDGDPAVIVDADHPSGYSEAHGAPSSS